MAIDVDDIEPGTNEAYVDGRCNAILAKQFMSIDPTTGNFMLPMSKVNGVQLYMRLSLTKIDSTWVPDLDQKFYKKNADDTFTEVEVDE